MERNHEMREKVVLITGATSGIGKETAVMLAKKGALVVVSGRSPTRAQEAVEEIRSRSHSTTVDLIVADLSSQIGVRHLATEFLNRYDKLHILINNAGLATKNREVTVDGIERQWAVNYLAPFLLTSLLIDCMKKSAPGRIINVSATLHKTGTLDFDDMEMTHNYKAVKMYARTKAALNSFTFELARQLEKDGITVNALHPGVIKTNFKATALFPMAALFRPFFSKPQKGALTSVYLAASPEMEGITGKYFIGHKPVSASQESRDTQKATQLYEMTLKQVGLPSVRA